MPIVNPLTGTIAVKQSGADIELVRLGSDNKTGADRFGFPDSTLAEEHVLIVRDLGRTVGGDGLISRKGKVTNLKEYVTVGNGKRSSLAISVSLGTQSGLSQSEVEKMYESLGDFLQRYKVELAKGEFDL